MNPKRRDELILTDIEATGESILVEPDGGHAVVLNPMAAVVWLLCDGERSVAAIIEEICASFPTEEERIADDVRAVLGHFQDEGILEPVDEPASEP